MSEGLLFLGVTVINLAFVFGLLINAGGVLTWVERKQGAVMANRIGANRAYIPIPIPTRHGLRWSKSFTLMGLFNGIADGAKFVLKEDFQAPFVEKDLYNLAPYFAVVPPMVTFAVIPFGGPFQPGQFWDAWYLSWIPFLPEMTASLYGERVYQLQLADLDAGLLFVFAMAGTGIFAAALAGWASNSKYALLGGLRASAQMISYEIAMGLSVIGLLLIYQTVNMREIVEIQANPLMWGIVLQPHMFFVFLASNIAENKRIPFDLPEGESEIVAGYHTEYSGMKLGLFMLSEFVEIAVIAGLMTTLFLGGYQVPGLRAVVDEYYWLANPGLTPGNYLSFLGLRIELANATVVLLRVGSFLAKFAFMCWFQILIRWTIPKFRYDQVMRLGWQIFLPFCLVNMVVTAGVVLLVQNLFA